jgi:hypothetical protein
MRLRKAREGGERRSGRRKEEGRIEKQRDIDTDKKMRRGGTVDVEPIQAQTTVHVLCEFSFSQQLAPYPQPPPLHPW